MKLTEEMKDQATFGDTPIIQELEREFCAPIMATLADGDMMIALKVTVILGAMVNRIEEHLNENTLESSGVLQ